MAKSPRYLVWVKESTDRYFTECGEGPLTEKQAERIAREIRQDCGCRAIHRLAELGEPFFNTELRARLDREEEENAGPA